MALFSLGRAVLPIIAGLMLIGCAQEDGSRIIGTWRAERLQVMSVKLPLGPELEIKRDKLAAGEEVSIPIRAITQDGNEVTLETDALVGMTFYLVGADRMYLDLPVVGRIYYQRVKDKAIAVPSASGTGPAAGPTLPKPVGVAEQASRPQPPVTSQLAQDEPEHVRDFARALILVRQGDPDGAIRSLHNAFKHGFRDTPLLKRTREFDVLEKDVRYQALLVRYNPE